MKFKLIAAIKNIFSVFESPWAAFGISFFVYFLLSFFHGRPWDVSSSPYFNYLADAFLHGQLNFRLLPPGTYDLVIYKGQLFSYWPPFPAMLLIPLVALFGVNFSDILFTIFFGSFNIFLFSALLHEAQKRNLIQLDKFQRSLLVFFFAYGTVHLTIAPLGRVWFTALIIGVTCSLFAYWAAIKYDGALGFFLAGLGISAAFATRLHLLIVGLWPAWYLISTHWGKPKKQLMKYVFIGLLPLAITGVLLLAYNYARFGNFSEVGLTYHNMGSIFRKDFSKYGAFSLHYAPTNLFYQYFAYPFLAKSSEGFFMGGSLFLLSPVFFSIFWGLWRAPKKPGPWILALTIVLTNIPIALLMGTGYAQFGPRYSLDFTVPLLLLTAKGVQHWPKRGLLLLVFVSVIQYLIGFVALAAI